MSPAELTALRGRCHTILPGHAARSPMEEFTAMAAWCEANQSDFDLYGTGDTVQQFEQKIADLLGFEAGLFMMTGTLTQITALRLASTERGLPNVALHPTAHILKHEKSNYQLLKHFNVLNVGDPFRPYVVDDLLALRDPLGAVLLELPMREIGGQLPSWEQLQDIKQHCQSQAIHLHMDGARLWECAAGYGRSHKEIAAGFDSVYVSFYKGIGGLGGAMLLGKPSFLERTALWAQRQGGNVFRRLPYVVSAAMQFDRRLAQMPACFERTRTLYELLRDYPMLKPNPARPVANMLHLHLALSAERATEVRNQIARDEGVWLFAQANHAALPDHCYVEWYIGDNLLNLPDAQLKKILDRWCSHLA